MNAERDIQDPRAKCAVEPFIQFQHVEFVRVEDPNLRPEDDTGEEPLGQAHRATFWLKRGAYVFWRHGSDWRIGPGGKIE